MCYMFIRCPAFFVLVSLTSVAFVASGKVRYFTLREKTRDSALVAIGRVTELRSTDVTIKVERFLKGHADESFALRWPRERTVEVQPHNYSVGDEVLVFANASGNIW